LSSSKERRTESCMLAKAAVDGKLATRADASKHQGDYRKIVDGFNETLDFVISPINDATSATGACHGTP